MRNAPEIDSQGLRQVAEAMISVRGADAQIEARRKAGEALDQGNVSEFRGWYRILRAVRNSLKNQ